MKLAVIGCHPPSLVNFRGPLLRAIRGRGHEVYAVASGEDEGVAQALREMGVEYRSVRMERTAMDPRGEIVALADLVRFLRRTRPDVLLNYTIKPVVWGGLAARICGIRSTYSLVTGLGYALTSPETVRQRVAGWVAVQLYRASLKRSHKVFFQNPDDMNEFADRGMVAASKCVVVDGSGVDLNQYVIEPDGDGSRSDRVRFLLVARLLRDKGIGEYAAAARRMGARFSQAQFHLVGPYDPNPSGLKKEEVDAWARDGIVQYWGEQRDVRPHYAGCAVYVLPSYYREGTPRTVLEAMAMGKPIVTTDAPGCRETVRPGTGGWRADGKLRIGANGILIPPRDAGALESAMEWFLLRREAIEEMGRESRRYAEERYDVRRVNETMLREMGL